MTTQSFRIAIRAALTVVQRRRESPQYLLNIYSFLHKINIGSIRCVTSVIWGLAVKHEIGVGVRVLLLL